MKKPRVGKSNTGYVDKTPSRKPLDVFHKLSDGDRKLWQQVIQSVNTSDSKEKPKSQNSLDRTTLSEQFEALLDAPPAGLKTQKPTKKQTQPATLLANNRQPPSKGSYATPIQTDPKTRKKIARGKLSLDARLDLHGLTQVQAYARLQSFIQQAHYQHFRTVLVITGKGNLGQGILRQTVPRWFTQDGFSNYISSYAVAHAVHGGDGAYYVKIRRRKLR